ncbi:MAG: IS3 family transposase [Treponema sp.]
MKDFELLKQIQVIQLEHSEKGYRKIWREIKRQGEEATEKQLRRVMKRFGVMAVFPGKNL